MAEKFYEIRKATLPKHILWRMYTCEVAENDKIGLFYLFCTFVLNLFEFFAICVDINLGLNVKIPYERG